ncbi:MAG: NADH-quinone oxidoreductase subunit L [Candidatus Eisenbacteria bacterium]|uniref:Probable inorganic carbon transporter subunit DabB n=1 Tax=Eiseniibacteriota bacterium TaxID=2212470 RepID=A0A956NG39_UNCEI|nr:NADH-quinone oxidoreductase subunit L [Candidatus Eisenbacteria bacterium]
MSLLVSFFPLLGPAVLALAALGASRSSGDRSARAIRLTWVAARINLALATAGAIFVILAGGSQSPVLGVGGFGFAVRLDALSAILFLLVAFVGTIVIAYSRSYLAGDDRHGRFVAGLCSALAAVSLLVVSGNLVQLIFGWIAASVAIHRLLLFYRNRPGAIVAARKKFWVARMGDACLILAVGFLVAAFGTADLAQVSVAVEAHTARGDMPGFVPAAAMLLAVAAMLKSAQFPTQGWLLEVMETPTPVSALLHAGIVNAGGFVIIRLADVMLTSPNAMYALAIVGGTTAVVASVVMLTQTSVKVTLAWSTVAQMGFMLFQCGLGVFAAAVLHIVAHSLYKAHAFLSAGSTIDVARLSAFQKATRLAAPRLASAVLGSAALLAAALIVWGAPSLVEPSHALLGGILALGLAQLLVQTAHDRVILPRTLLTAGFLAIVYVGLQGLSQHALSAALPAPHASMHGSSLVLAVAVVLFAAIALVQWFAPYRRRDPRWQAMYVHARNGFYANAVFSRLVGALRHPLHSAHQEKL